MVKSTETSFFCFVQHFTFCSTLKMTHCVLSEINYEYVLAVIKNYPFLWNFTGMIAINAFFIIFIRKCLRIL
jgi:hypothetical protein